MKKDINEHSLSPCISYCKVGVGGICMGCYRSQDEVLEWATASAERKLQILENCRKRKYSR